MKKVIIKPPIPLTPKSVTILFLLIVLGFIGNFWNLPLFFGVDFILGSIAVFIVLYFYGLGLGVLAALVASSYTYALWGHPYAVIIFSLEALFVGLFWENGRRSLLLLDALFWLVIGIPMVWICYGVVMHMDGISTQLIMLKQSVNGLFNALMASLALNHLPWGKFLEPGAPRRTTSLRQTLLNLLVAVILVPALAIMVFNSRTEVQESKKNIVYHMELVAADIVAQLSLWQQQNLRAVTQLADLAAKTSLEPSPALQHDTEVIDKAIAYFRSMCVANAQGTTIAFSPAVSQEQSNIGINYADRRYFQEMQTTRRPVLSEVMRGRAILSPAATLSVPIFRGEYFRGFASGGLDLQRVQEMLKPFGKQAHLHITLIDSHANVITSTQSDRQPLMPWKRQGGNVQPIRDSVYQWLPGGDKQPSMVRWKNSFYVGEYTIPDLPWKLVVEAPLAPLQKRLYLIYVRNLTIMAGLTLVVLPIAMLFTRWLVHPLAGLAQVTSNLPDKVVAQQDIIWPESLATEMQSLVANFKTMTGSLTAYVQDLQAANTGLTIEIEERVRVEAALRDSEERYRLLADNARDVIWRLDHNQQFIYISPSVQLLTGFSAEETMDRGLAGMLTPASLQMALDTIARLQEVELGERPALPPAATLELEVFRKDGGTVWIEVHASYLRNFQGHFTGFMGVARDITARWQAEAALLAERNKFKNVLETMPNGVYIVNRSYDIEYLNPVLESEFGPVAGRKCYQYFHERSEPCLWCKNSEVFAGKSMRWEWQSAKTGKIYDLFDTPLVNADGSISKFEIFHDISERKQAETEIIRQREELRGLAARLAEVEEAERQQLARELHDQVCQNLTSIAITIETLKIKAHQETLAHLLSRLSEASALAEQTGEITRDIMEGLRPTVLDHYGLTGGLRQLGSHFSQRTGINLEIQGEEPDFRLMPNVELALFRIAQEALNNVAKHSRASQVVLTEEVDQDTMRLIIADNGTGFNQNLVAQPKEGRGWGLMTMTERALAIGGICRIESQPGQGTRVTVEVSR
jgi:PAS domain S-box-containing protein